MNNLNMPLFRAKKLGTNEYEMGFLLNNMIVTAYEQEIKRDGIYWKSITATKIDPSTLAINFPNMLDSQENKIFASLSGDGKGGDILYYEDDCQPYICEHSSNGTFLFEYLDNKTIKNYICRLSQEKVLFEDLKVIGIQE